MVNAQGQTQIFNLNGSPWPYQCAANENWLKFRMDVDKGFIERIGNNRFGYWEVK